MRTQLRAQHYVYDGYFGLGALTSLERGGARRDCVGVVRAERAIAEAARQFDVSTSLTLKVSRDAQQTAAMFVPAVMAQYEVSLLPDVPGDVLADSPVMRLDLADGTKVSIAATAPAWLVLAVLRALR